MTNYSDEKNPYRFADYKDIYRDGYLAAEKDFGWHRNCAESPVPKKTIEATFDFDFTRCVDMVRFNERNGWYFSGYFRKNIRAVDIIYWREIPEVEE